MTPDDIFAANMWAWPDPLLKRDTSGRVVFVNAAFLQLYGGRIENWTGHPVQGWPAPQAQGQPYRFETRIDGQSGQIVYDWVEVTMADGNALAIARDVTVFAQAQHSAPAAQPQQAPIEPPAQQAAQDVTTAPIAPPVVPAIAPEPAPIAPPAAASQSMQQQDIHEAQAEQAPIEPIASAPQAQAPVQAAPVQDAPVQDAAVQAAQEPAPQQPAQNIETVSQPPRDFERRALPIEDGDAVLGNNWRDAVIARAVGASDDDNAASSEAPATEEKAENTSKDADTPVQSAKGLRILLAEDNAINALLTRTLLEAEGCTVETVEDGELAVKAMETNMYDLIFMDMRMPNMDGLEATRKIRSMGARTADLPIIALTANAFDDDRNACFDSGMNDFMTKPVSAEELSHMVKTWTEKKTAA